MRRSGLIDLFLAAMSLALVLPLCIIAIFAASSSRATEELRDRRDYLDEFDPADETNPATSRSPADRTDGIVFLDLVGTQFLVTHGK
jgi:hypothetical protein